MQNYDKSHLYIELDRVDLFSVMIRITLRANTILLGAVKI